ncbi:hypothetical protein V5O48_008473 [Marasmius crinis-equi]|uniref:F-box domain-containing protein n=1 Tax=Marasmius crinis-equi TaxID=585013 RepID=A0ABR3FDV7_9AGAR
MSQAKNFPTVAIKEAATGDPARGVVGFRSSPLETRNINDVFPVEIIRRILFLAIGDGVITLAISKPLPEVLSVAWRIVEVCRVWKDICSDLRVWSNITLHYRGNMSRRAGSDLERARNALAFALERTESRGQRLIVTVLVEEKLLHDRPVTERAHRSELIQMMRDCTVGIETLRYQAEGEIFVEEALDVLRAFGSKIRSLERVELLLKGQCASTLQQLAFLMRMLESHFVSLKELKLWLPTRLTACGTRFLSNITIGRLVVEGSPAFRFITHLHVNVGSMLFRDLALACPLLSSVEWDKELEDGVGGSSGHRWVRQLVLSNLTTLSVKWYRFTPSGWYGLQKLNAPKLTELCLEDEQEQRMAEEIPKLASAVVELVKSSSVRQMKGQLYLRGLTSEEGVGLEARGLTLEPPRAVKDLWSISTTE